MAIHHSPRKKRKQYTPQQMEKALEAVASGWSSVRDATLLHDGPVSTLHNRASGRVICGVKTGPVKKWLLEHF